MNKFFITFIFCSSILIACSKKQATAVEIAPEMCNCFAIVEKDIIVLKELIPSLAESSDPNKSLKEFIDNVTMAGPMPTLVSDLDKLSTIDDEKTATGTCFKNLQKKYRDRYDFKNEAIAFELIAELKKQNCGFAAGMLNWKWKR